MGVPGNLAVGRGLVRTHSRRSLLGEETQSSLFGSEDIEAVAISPTRV